MAHSASMARRVCTPLRIWEKAPSEIITHIGALRMIMWAAASSSWAETPVSCSTRSGVKSLI